MLCRPSGGCTGGGPGWSRPLTWKNRRPRSSRRGPCKALISCTLWLWNGAAEGPLHHDGLPGLMPQRVSTTCGLSTLRACFVLCRVVCKHLPWPARPKLPGNLLQLHAVVTLSCVCSYGEVGVLIEALAGWQQWTQCAFEKRWARAAYKLAQAHNTAAKEHIVTPTPLSTTCRRSVSSDRRINSTNCSCKSSRHRTSYDISSRCDTMHTAHVQLLSSHVFMRIWLRCPHGPKTVPTTRQHQHMRVACANNVQHKQALSRSGATI